MKSRAAHRRDWGQGRTESTVIPRFGPDDSDPRGAIDRGRSGRGRGFRERGKEEFNPEDIVQPRGT